MKRANSIGWFPLLALALLAALVALMVSLVDTIPPTALTRGRMHSTERRLRDYARLHGRLPASLSDLPPLEPDRNGRLIDAWDRPIQYLPHGRECTLLSLGRDGLPGGAGDDADLRLAFSLDDDDPAASQPATTREGDARAESDVEGGRTFNSRLALLVSVRDENGGRRVIGCTPATRPLEIPKCQEWTVEPLEGVSVADVMAEANAQPICGIVLPGASDADLAAVKVWPRLHLLALTSFANTDAGLVHLKKLKALREIHLDSSPRFMDRNGFGRFAMLAGSERVALGLPRVHLTWGQEVKLNLREDEGWPEVPPPAMTDAAVEELTKLKEVRVLSLTGYGITDAGLGHLKDVKGLQKLELDLAGPRITDAGLAHLKGLEALETLALRFTAVTDDGLANLEGLKGLRRLGITRMKITDAGLSHLAGLTTLRELDLTGLPITDAGLVHLKGLKSLERVNLESTHVTAAGMDELRKALPNTTITQPATTPESKP